SHSTRLPPSILLIVCFFFTDTAPTEIYTLSLHDALPIWPADLRLVREAVVPPQVLVRGTYGVSKRADAAADPLGRGPSNRARPNGRVEAGGHQGRPGNDLEDEDSRADRERRPPGETRRLRV